MPFGRRNVMLALLAIGAIIPAFANGYQLFVGNLVDDLHPAGYRAEHS